MNLASGFARKFAFPLLEAFIGRKNTVRLARSLTMASRLDVPNAMSSNGEHMVQEVILKQAAGRAVVLDVGANAGDWTRSLLQAAGSANVEVHAFEPASATFAILQRNLGSDKRVDLVEEALSSAPGQGQLHIVGQGLGVNSLHPRPDGKASETIKLNTVDQYCSQHHIRHVHLLKIDAEGHDLAVLEGGRGMLSTKSIDAVQFEYNQRWIDSRRYLKDAFELLQPFGYELGKVTPKGIEFYPAYHFELESFREGNYLACLPGLRSAFPQVKWWNLE